MWTEFTNVLWKEWTDTIRDSRSLVAGLAYALFGPFVLYAALSFAAGEIEEETHIPLAVVGAEYAPNLVEALEDNKITVTPFKTEATARASIGNGNRVLLVIPDDYGETYRALEPTRLYLYADFSDNKAEVQARRVSASINGYGSRVAWMRMVAHGVAPSTAMPMQLALGDISKAGGVAGKISGFVLYFFVLATFMGGMSIAADTTAGERERQSLQPLLAQPVSKLSLVLGKWLNTVTFCIFTTLITVVAGSFALGAAPLGELGIRLQLTPGTQALMALALLPLVLCVTAAQMAIALWSKGHREAMTYLNMLIFVPALIAMFTVFIGDEPEGWANLLPVTNQIALLRDVMLDGWLPPNLFGAGAAVALAVAAACLGLVTVRLNSEKVLSHG